MYSYVCTSMRTFIHENALVWYYTYIGPIFFSGRRSFLALSAAGHAGSPRELTAQGWAPDGLRGARSEHSKSREPWQVITGIAFRRGRASQGNGNPTVQLFGSSDSLHAVPFLTATDVIVRVWTTAMRAWTSLTRVHFCAGTRMSFTFWDTYRCEHILFLKFVPQRCVHFRQFMIYALLALLLYHGLYGVTLSFKLYSSLICGGHGTTAVAHQALPFATAMDGASLVSAFLCHVSYQPI